MKNRNIFLYLFLFFTFLLCSLGVSQTLVPNNRVSIYLKNDKHQQIQDATIIFSPDYSGTNIDYQARFIRDGIYEAELPINVADGGRFSVEIVVKDHETYMDSYYLPNDKVSFKILHNNYYKEFDVVERSSLIEQFGPKIPVDFLPNPAKIPIGAVAQLPSPIPCVVPFVPDQLKPIILSDFTFRKNLYVELLKEVVLQTSASSSGFALKTIETWISSNYESFGGSGQPQTYLDVLKESSGIFGFTLHNAASKRIQGFTKAAGIAGIVYEAKKAADEGLLKALILAVAYEHFYSKSLDVLEDQAKSSLLYTDDALKEALQIVRMTLEKEARNNLNELVLKMQVQYASGAIAKDVVTTVLPQAAIHALGIATGPGIVLALVTQFAVDYIIGTTAAQKYINSMLLLAQIDEYILAPFYERYSPQLEKDILKDENIYFGTLMRVHVGSLYHQLRKKYYGGEASKTVELSKSLFSTAYEREIVRISRIKAKTSALDYYRISRLDPSEGSKTGFRKVSQSSLIILDTSGSMGNSGKTNGSSKLDEAKSAISSVLASFVTEKTSSQEWALMVYNGCTRTPIIQDFTQKPELVLESLQQITARFKTPLARSIEEGAAYIRQNGVGNAGRIIVLTDGGESCRGNPVDAANQVFQMNRAIPMSYNFLLPNAAQAGQNPSTINTMPIQIDIIGFTVDPASQVAELLRQVATAGGGQYYTAANTQQLIAALKITFGYDTSNWMVVPVFFFLMICFTGMVVGLYFVATRLRTG